VAGLRAHGGCRVLRPRRRLPRLRARQVDAGRRLEPAHPAHPGADDLDDRLLLDRLLRPAQIRLRRDPEAHRRAARGDPAVARGGLASRGPHARRRARQRADLGSDCGPRLLASGGVGIAIAHRIYAEAIFGAAKDAGRLAQVHEALVDFATAAAESPELRAVLRNPQLESSAKAAILADLAGDEEPLFTHFLQVVAEKGRAAELEEIAKEFERLMAREERRLTVELTTARELSDAESEAILKQI